MFRAVLILSLLASPAFAFSARNAVQVSGNSEKIVVASRSGLSSAQAWCGAGDFVISALRLPTTTRIYRISPPPRRATEGIVFSLSATGASEDTGLNTFGKKDNSVSAGHAVSLCTVGRWEYQ